MPCAFSYNETSTLVIVDVIYWEQVVTAILVGFIAIAGLFGNSMIILAVSFSRQLQTATNTFVTNLAVADLLTSFVLIWYTVGALGKGEWPIPGACWICEATAFFTLTSLGTSTHNLAAIAFNRLIRIRYPNKYKKIFTVWKVVFFIAMTWIIPVGSFAVVFATGFGVLGYSPRNHVCGSWNKDDHQILFITQVLIGLLIPGIIILISYIWIYVFVKRHFRVQKENLPTISVKLSAGNGSGNESSKTSRETEITEMEDQNPPSENMRNKTIPAESRQDTLSRQQVKITKNLFLIVCAFFGCFMPYFLLGFFRHHSAVDHIGFYIKVTPLANSCINFVIYARKHPDFKIVMGHMMKRSYADIPQPSRFLKYILSKKE